jgi:hypothetical protein
MHRKSTPQAPRCSAPYVAALASSAFVLLACAEDPGRVPAEPRPGAPAYWESTTPREPGPAPPNGAPARTNNGGGHTDKFLWQEPDVAGERDAGADGGDAGPR